MESLDWFLRGKAREVSVIVPAATGPGFLDLDVLLSKAPSSKGASTVVKEAEDQYSPATSIVVHGYHGNIVSPK